VNELHSLIKPIQDAEFPGQLAGGASPLESGLRHPHEHEPDTRVFWKIARGMMGPDGQPLLNDAERALLGRLMDRARKAAKAGGLPIPDELYFQAKQGDPEAIRQLRQILQNVGEGVGKGAEIAAKIIFGILGVLGAAARRARLLRP
jgi:hypothetical protein